RRRGAARLLVSDRAGAGRGGAGGLGPLAPAHRLELRDARERAGHGGVSGTGSPDRGDGRLRLRPHPDRVRPGLPSRLAPGGETEAALTAAAAPLSPPRLR